MEKNMGGIEIIIGLAIAIVLFILFSFVMIVSIAWTHYPYGILKAMREKKKREKNAKNN